MKRNNILLNKAALVVVFIIAMAANVSAARITRDASKELLDRTTTVLAAAQNELKVGHVYTGNFAQAIAHQRYANTLWEEGNYSGAVHHSRRARVLALTVININNGAIKSHYDFTKNEQRFIKSAPHDELLDKVIEKDLSMYYRLDQDFITAVIDDIDLEDFE